MKASKIYNQQICFSHCENPKETMNSHPQTGSDIKTDDTTLNYKDLKRLFIHMMTFSW